MKLCEMEIRALYRAAIVQLGELAKRGNLNTPEAIALAKAVETLKKGMKVV